MYVPRPARPSILAFHLASLPVRRTGVGAISDAARLEEFLEFSKVLPVGSLPERVLLTEDSFTSPRFSTSFSGIW